MRILLVSHYVPPNGLGGVQNYTINLARSFAAAGHEVAVYARGGRTDVAEGIEEATDRFGNAFTVTESHPGKQPLFPEVRVRLNQSAHFTAFVQRFRPDIVHLHHLLYHSLDYPQIAKRAGAAVVVTLHDFWFTCPTIQRLDFAGALCQRTPGVTCLPCLWGGRRDRVIPRTVIRQVAELPLVNRALDLVPSVDELKDWAANSARSLHNADVVIAPSQFMADDLTAAGIVPKRLIVSDYGIPQTDTAEVRSPAQDGRLHFGIIGSHPLKGPQVAVEAFRKLTDLPVCLHLFGTDSFPDLPHNVHLGGRFTAAEIEKVYAAFDVLIVPSIWYENAPFVIREAFARQRPVIASDIGGMRESVRDGIDGLHFAVGNADALAGCIRRFLAEPDLLATLRAGIRPPKFYDEHIAELLGLYQGVVA